MDFLKIFWGQINLFQGVDTFAKRLIISMWQRANLSLSPQPSFVSDQISGTMELFYVYIKYLPQKSLHLDAFRCIKRQTGALQSPKIILAQDQPTSREFHRYSYFLHNSGLTPHSSSKWAKISLPYHRSNDPKSGMRAQATASAGARTPKLCDVVGVSSVSRRMKNGRTKQLSLLEPPSVWLSTGLGSYTCT